MILQSFHIRNFRRLRDVHITLEPDRTIFVGANNSGKTSAAHALSLFLREEKFLMYDFSAEAWNKFDDVAKRDAKAANDPVPSISIDLWFQIAAGDLHRVIDLVPDLNWEIGPVGVRIELAVKSPPQLLADFMEAKKKAAPPKGEQGKDDAGYSPWPRSVTDYLIKRFDQEFEFRYFVLDRSQFDEKFNSKPDYVPQPLGDDRRSGAKILQSLIRVNFMKAQRDMAGEGTSDRAEDLSRRFGRFYKSHLKQHEADFDALRALANSESQLNQHYDSVFKDTLNRLGQLGYPGLTEAQLLIRAVVDGRQILEGGASVHYALGGDDKSADKLLLPDKYNGLGYKNLIYMVIELLDFHSRWASETEDRALLHLILIEEPEAHLHTQMQQVFIREIQRILPDESAAGFSRQLVVTTHSPHILYAAGFTPIRYFRRIGGPGRKQHSQVLNLSEFYRTSEKEPRDFLQRYMELTHCDLFFADAAILVEGTVERLLMPAMVHKSATSLESSYLSVLEVGGAYGHIFKSLIEFLGLTTLVITDLDSVLPKAPKVAATGDAAKAEADEDEDGQAEGDTKPPGSKCLVDTPGAVTSNQTLVKWLPAKSLISELLAADEKAKIQPKNGELSATVRVAYQVVRDVTWNGQTERRAARTLEEAFGLENLAWCQDRTRRSLGLRIKKAEELTSPELAKAIYERVASSAFDKTDFALAVIAQDEKGWIVPFYIDEGLKWLAKQCVPEIPQVAIAAAIEKPEQTA